MRTLLSACLLTMTVVLTHAMAVGEDHSHRKAAENLLVVMEAERHLQELATQVLEAQLTQHPQLAAHRDVMQRFLSKYLPWDSLKGDIITVYTQEFTEQELKQLTDFYKTPLGKKASEKIPRL